MKMPVVKDQASPGEVVKVDPPKMLLKLPTVTECVVQPQWEDGVPKGERSLFVFLEGALVKILFKVSNPPLKLMVSGRSWDDAWAALEVVLRTGDPPWEQDERGASARGQKGKK